MGSNPERIGYLVTFIPTAEREFKKLSKDIQKRIKEKLNWLSENAHQITHVQLSHLPDELKNLCKYRIGSYRLLYYINHSERIIEIHGVMDRKEDYRRLR